jgi:hypothetical protein
MSEESFKEIKLYLNTPLEPMLYFSSQDYGIFIARPLPTTGIPEPPSLTRRIRSGSNVDIP